MHLKTDVAIQQARINAAIAQITKLSPAEQKDFFIKIMGTFEPDMRNTFIEILMQQKILDARWLLTRYNIEYLFISGQFQCKKSSYMQYLIEQHDQPNFERMFEFAKPQIPNLVGSIFNFVKFEYTYASDTKGIANILLNLLQPLQPIEILRLGCESCLLKAILVKDEAIVKLLMPLYPNAISTTAANYIKQNNVTALNNLLISGALKVNQLIKGITLVEFVLMHLSANPNPNNVQEPLLSVLLDTGINLNDPQYAGILFHINPHRADLLYSLLKNGLEIKPEFIDRRCLTLILHNFEVFQAIATQVNPKTGLSIQNLIDQQSPTYRSSFHAKIEHVKHYIDNTNSGRKSPDKYLSSPNL